MAKLTLMTKAARAIIPPGKRDVLIFDETQSGFGVRKFESGKMTFFVKYQLPNGKQRRLSLGDAVPGMEDEKRKEASRIRSKAEDGQDTVAERQALALKGTTMGSLVTKYLAARRSEVSSRHYVEIVRYLENYWRPLHGIVIDEVKRKDIVQRLNDIAAEKGKVTADRARTALSAFFGWAIEEQCLEATNPARDIKRRANGDSRTRALSEGELMEVWRACSGDDDYSRIVKLLILTGQRKSEISELSRSEIDREKALIDLPEERTKNGLPHLVPLSAQAFAVIDAVPPRYGRELLFGEGARGFQGWSRAKDALDKRIKAAREKAGKQPIKPWVLHDLRRSVVTCLGERKVPPHVVEMLVNHQSGHKSGVAGIYNKAEYLPERRKALQKWGLHLSDLIAEGGK